MRQLRSQISSLSVSCAKTMGHQIALFKQRPNADAGQGQTKSFSSVLLLSSVVAPSGLHDQDEGDAFR